MSDIGKAIRMLAGGNEEIYCLICTVDSVDEEARTIDCTPIDEEAAPVLGVNLQADQGSEIGLVHFPAVDSFVVVAFLNQSAGVVVLMSEIVKTLLVIGNTTIELDEENITVNGGELGGLIIVGALTEKLNALTNKFNALVKLYNAHVHTTTATIGEGPAVGVLSATTSTAQEADLFVRDDYENKRVKH